MIKQKEHKILCKKQCSGKCGRRLILVRDDGKVPKGEFFCSVCKKYGVEYSRKEFQLNKAKVLQKSKRTIIE